MGDDADELAARLLERLEGVKRFVERVLVESAEAFVEEQCVDPQISAPMRESPRASARLTMKLSPPERFWEVRT